MATSNCAPDPLLSASCGTRIVATTKTRHTRLRRPLSVDQFVHAMACIIASKLASALSELPTTRLLIVSTTAAVKLTPSGAYIKFAELGASAVWQILTGNVHMVNIPEGRGENCHLHNQAPV